MMHLIGSTKVEQEEAPGGGGVLLGSLSWRCATRFFKKTRTCLTCFQTARFSKAPVINGPVKLLLFTCKIEVSVGFISNMIKLSVSKIKWSSLLARTRALILYIKI